MSAKKFFLFSFVLLFIISSFPGRKAWLFGGEEEQPKEEEKAPEPTAEATESVVSDLLAEDDDEETELPMRSPEDEARVPENFERAPHETLDHDHWKDGVHNDEFDHQAILGTKEEAEEYQDLPKEEAKKRLAGLIKKIDADGDTFVTHEELQKWVVKSFVSLNEEESLARYKEHDQDADGKLSWEEYLRSVYGYVPTVSELTDMDNVDARHFVRIYREDEAKFQACDVDKDGVVTAEEFGGFYHPEDFSHMHDIEMARIIAETDKDGDGAIDLEEFVGDLGGEDQDEWRAVETDRFKRGLDKDGSGKLEGEEIKAWAIPSNDDIAKDEATHLIGVADKNRDAQLSEEEILEESDLFVGSAVTDYGKHLNDEL